MMPSLDKARLVRLKLSILARDDTSTALRECIAQIPDAASLEPGTLVAIAAQEATERGSGLLGRIAKMGPRVQIHRAMRCTGLLARGYVRIAAGADEHGADWAWGYVPDRS